MSKIKSKRCSETAGIRVERRDDGYFSLEKTHRRFEKPLPHMGAKYTDPGSSQSVTEPVAVVVYAHESNSRGDDVCSGTPAPSVFHTDIFRTGESRARVSGRK